MKKYESYMSNLRVLQKADQEDLNNEFIISGIIDRFSLQFELGWKVLKELLKYEGKSIANTGSPREIIKAAYTIYDFIDEEIWLSMLRSRNDMTHIYNGEAAAKLVQTILDKYIPAFETVGQGISLRYRDMLDKKADA